MSAAPNTYASDLSFKDLLGILGRQKAVIWLNVALFLAIGVVVSLFSTPAYRSIAKVLIEAQPKVVNTNDPMLQLSQRDSAYDVPTQIQVLQSQEILSKALERSGIPFPAEPSAKDLERLPKVDVQQVADSNVIQISLEASNPDYCIKLASVLPSVYEDYVRAKQRVDVGRGVVFLQDRIKEETAQLSDRQKNLAAFKQQNKVVDSQNELTVRVNQSTQSESEAAAAQSAVNSAQAQLDSILAARQALPDERMVPTLQSNLLQIETEKKALQQMLNEREQLLVHYLPDSLEVRTADARIQAQREYLAGIPEKVTTMVRSRNPELDVYDQKVADARALLQAALARRTEAFRVAGAKDAHLRDLTPIARNQAELERQIADNQATLARLSQTLDDIRLRDNSLRTPINDITPATPPVKVRPRWSLNLAVALVLGLVFGVFAALVRDTMQDKVNYPEEACAIAEADLLGKIPLRPKQREALIANPATAKAFEGYRIVRSSLVFGSGPENGPVSDFMVTSTRPGEGKSVVAANLAVAMALDSRRVILVDADLRNPAQEGIFGVQPGPGLADVLIGQATLEQALHNGRVEGLSLLPAGSLPANPAEMLSSPAMRELHKKLLDSCDVLIYDSSSLLPLADAQALASVVGKVLLLNEPRAASKSDMREAVGLVDLAQAKVIGIVVNKTGVRPEELG